MATDNLEAIIAAGKELGYTDQDLRDYVKEQQDRLRDERVALRQREKEEREAQREKEEREAQREKEEREAHKEREERERQVQKEREERQAQKEKEERDREAQKEKEERAYNLEIERMYQEVKLKELNVKSGSGEPEVRTKASIPKLPPFDESRDEMDSYLRRFERYATAQKWDRGTWATSLSALLRGRALDVYALMSLATAQDYDELKAALLRRFDMTEDGFKKKFRSSRPDLAETFTQFTVRLSSYFTRWIEMAKIPKTYDGLFDLILRDQLLHICNQELAIFLRQNVPKTASEMCKLADQFSESRFANAVHLCFKPSKKPPNKDSAQSKDKQNKPLEKPQHFVPLSERKCYFCEKKGHIATNCPNKSKGKFSGAVIESNDQELNVNCSALIMHQNPSVDSWVSDKTMILTSACHSNEKQMPISAGYVNGHPVTLLRDSGCRNIVVRKSLVQAGQFTGEKVTCILADSTERIVPVANIHIDSPYLTGNYNVWCMDTPVFDLIIGEVSGARKPHHPDPNWKPILAVETRQQKKDKAKPYTPLKVPDIVVDTVKPEDIRREQESDVSLNVVRQNVRENKTSIDGKVTWFSKDGLMYREFKGDKIYSQLIVPSKFRNTVMKLAHESIMAGHLATSRTINRIVTEFYWPGMQSDIKRFCRSCDTCQKTEPRGKVRKVPMDSMPIIDEPFKRVAVDLIGPLHPPTEKGNRFILTLVDYATRYPEAIALPGIDTERVAEALVEMFSRIGVPQEMLTDMGSQFTSSLMKEVSRLISMKQLTTTPYHPMCNGLVERFNGTLKQMLKRLCTDRPKDWDKYLAAVLFAYREVPQESLGFSPFELVYGRTVRGPITILKELWTREIKDPEVKTTYQYVLDLRERLESTCELAHSNLEEASKRYKKYYDRRARRRNMKQGDKVLILLPTDSNKLLMQWKGPYVINEKLNKVDYQIDVNGKLKTFHANLLKQYVERQENECTVLENNILAAVSTKPVDADDQEIEVSLFENQTYLDVDINKELQDNQRKLLMKALSEFTDVITDRPGNTSLLQHDVRTTTEKPVRVSPRPLPLSMVDTIKDEVRKMLELKVIEPSESPYSSPIVLVAKKDGTHRFCIDFRSLNRITIFDAEPMPDIDAMFSKLAGHQYFSRLDLTKGYWQVPLTSDSRAKTAFQTPMGLFQFTKMPFGLVTAPATFCRLMRKVLRDLQNVDNFIDDILIFSMTFEKHISDLTSVLRRLREANLTAKPSKCAIAYHQLECLGHIIGREMIQPHPDKVKVIRDASRPTTKKQLRSFLGLVNFYRKFIPNCSHVSLPLTDLTRKFSPNKIQWTESQEIAFQHLKRALTTSPILKLPDMSQVFILQTDASDRGLGAVLLQEENGQKRPIAYISRKLNNAEENYSTIERECLSIVWSIQKLHKFLYGREFLLETDHQPLIYLNSSKLLNARLMRWALTLQPYRFRIISIKGKENVGADFLSRL